MSGNTARLDELLLLLSQGLRRPIQDINADAGVLSEEIGLDSLATAMLVTELEERYGMRFDIEEAERAMGGTVRELAAYIAGCDRMEHSI